MEQSSFNEALNAARQKAAQGDIDRAAKYFDEALWKAEQHGLQEHLSVLKEAIEFYAVERLDTKLIASVQKLLSLTKSDWKANDQRYLLALDHLARAYFRTRQAKQLEETVLRALEIEKAVSGEKSDSYARRLEYAVNMLADCGKKELAETLKGISRDIKLELKSSSSQEFAKPRTTGQRLLADRRIYLGLILTGAGLVPMAKFQENLQAAKQLGMHVGEVLVSAGLITNEHLYTALQLQSLARSSKITLETATEAFSMACNNNLPLEELMNQFDLQKYLVEDMDRLGRILESAGLLTEESLETALAETGKNRIPLARYLVTNKIVAPTAVAQALELQNYIRNGNISREAAIAKLKNYAGKKPSLQVRNAHI